MKHLRKSIYTISSLLIWICVWDIFCFWYVKDTSIFPSSLMIIKNTWLLLFEKNLIWNNLFHSFMRFLLGALIALPLAYILAVASGGTKFFRWLLEPIVLITFPLPKVALFPLIILLLGIDDSSKIFLIMISIFYLVFINTFQGAKTILSSPMMDVVYSYKIQGLNFWYHYLMKGCWPFFLVGVRTGLGYGITVVVVSEWTLSKNGIGFFIWSSWDQYRVLDMYSGIFILAIIGYILYLISEKIEMAGKKYYFLS